MFIFFKKNYFIKLNKKLEIHDFDFLYEDFLKKENDEFLFSSFYNHKQKLRKNNIVSALKIFCYELNENQSISINYNDFINASYIGVININDELKNIINNDTCQN